MSIDSASMKNKIKYIQTLNKNSQKDMRIYLESLFMLNESLPNLIFYSIFYKTLKNIAV